MTAWFNTIRVLYLGGVTSSSVIVMAIIVMVGCDSNGVYI